MAKKRHNYYDIRPMIFPLIFKVLFTRPKLLFP